MPANVTPHRIVSMLPSATEIVHGLGLSSSLVGISHECDFPSSIQNLPVVTFAHIDASAPSAQIETDVQARLAQSLSIYGIHHNRLRQLQPKTIITQTQCEVCAVSLADVEACLRNDQEIQAELLVLAPNTLAEVWEDIRKVARSLDVLARAEALLKELDERLDSIKRRTVGKPVRRVLMMEWIDPLMAAGNWIPELVQIAGGTSLFGQTGVHSDWLEWSAIQAADPDIIIVTPCGFDLPRTLSEIPPLFRHSGWAELTAVKTGNVFAVDGNAFFNRPGPRLVESTEILAEILHPDRFDFGHAEKDWQRCPGI